MTKSLRLTQRDWKVINAALAFYQAEDLEDEAENHGYDEIDDYAAVIQAAREKVWARLPMDKETT